MSIDKKYIDICEELGWTVHEYDGFAELESYSPAGENLVFTVHFSEDSCFAESVKDLAADFDMEEHVRGLLESKKNGFPGVPDMFTLVDDVRKIDKMLQGLASALCYGIKPATPAVKSRGDVLREMEDDGYAETFSSLYFDGHLCDECPARKPECNVENCMEYWSEYLASPAESGKAELP